LEEAQLAQTSLEQYVASRYAQELTNAGYQPVCQDAEEMIEDALKIMAALNQASQFVKQNILNRRQATA
jgi:hypothetical protein